MLVLAGLGNPGSKFSGNRHNVGFMAADALAGMHGFGPWKPRFQALVCEGMLGGEKTLLIKPATFMNESGRAVGEVLRFYKLEPADLVVMYDELDLPAGKIRMKTGGGSGGHNGIRSIEAHVGKDFRRMRIGIGHPGSKAQVHNYVLGDFSKADRSWLDPLLDEIARNAPLLAQGEDSTFMNRVHLALNPAGKDPKPAPAAAKGQSHIRQARTAKPSASLPEKGPMAEMLKKLFANKPT